MKTFGQILVAGSFFISSMAFGQVWVQQITGGNVNIESIAADRQGNCFVSGVSIGNSNEIVNFGPTNLNLGPFFARYSRTGDLLYAQRTDQTRLLASVGSKVMAIEHTKVWEIRDDGRALLRTELETPDLSVTAISPCDGTTFVISGYFREHLTIGKRSLIATDRDGRTAFVARLHTSGKPIWMTQLPGSYVYDVAGTRTGGAYALTGFEAVALGSQGEPVWTNGIPGSYFGSPYAIAADGAGNCLLTGNFYGEILTPNGETINGRHWVYVYSFYSDGQPWFAWSFSASSADWHFGMDVATDREGNWYSGLAFLPGESNFDGSVLICG